MKAFLASIILAAQEEEVGEPADLYPQLSELIVAALAFGVLFFFMWKFAIPRINQILEARREKIQGDLEKAEEARTGAEKLLADYRQQLSGAREEGNRIIEEARKTAEQLRRDMEQKAEKEYQSIVNKAQEDIRAERDRVMQELKAQVGQISVVLAGRMVGESLDPERHSRLVDDYIEELGALAPSGNGHGAAGGSGGDGPEGQ